MEKKGATQEVEVKIEFNMKQLAAEITTSLQTLTKSLKSDVSAKVKEIFDSVDASIRSGVKQSETDIQKSLSSMKNTVASSFKDIDSATSVPSQSGGKKEAGGGKGKTLEGLSGAKDAITGIQEQFNALANGVNEMSPIMGEAIQPFVTTISEGMGLTTSLLGGIVGLGTHFTSLTAITPMLTGGLSGLFAVMKANPFATIVTIITILVSLFMSLYNNNEGFRNSVNELIAGLVEKFMPVIDAICVALSDFWTNVLVPLANEFIKFVTESIQPLCVIIMDVLMKAFDNLKGALEYIWVNILVPLGEFLISVFCTAIEFLIKMWDNLKPVINKVGEILQTIWTNVLVPLGEFLKGALSNAIDFLIKTWDTLKGSIDAISDVFMFLWDEVLSPLGNFIADVFVAYFTSMFDQIDTCITSVKGIFSGIIDFVTGVFTGNWKKAWEGVKDIFKNVFDGLVGLIKGPLNLAIDIVNKGIDGINKIGFDIPDWLGGGRFSMNIPKIPRLATGGIISQPTLALVGESGKEAVMPLERNTGWIQNLAGNISSQLNGGQMNQRSEKILLELLQAVKSLNLNIDGKRATSLLDNSKKELAMLR